MVSYEELVYLLVECVESLVRANLKYNITTSRLLHVKMAWWLVKRISHPTTKYKVVPKIINLNSRLHDL